MQKFEEWFPNEHNLLFRQVGKNCLFDDRLWLKGWILREILCSFMFVRIKFSVGRMVFEL